MSAHTQTARHPRTATVIEPLLALLHLLLTPIVEWVDDVLDDDSELYQVVTLVQAGLTACGLATLIVLALVSR